MAIIRWNKKYGETLAVTLKRFRREMIEFKNEKVTYAGRLDPLAEGLLILLTGNDVHRKNEFLHLDKVYEVDFFFGINTDSYDVLGRIVNTFDLHGDFSEKEFEKKLKSHVGKLQQEYPPYSSKTVNGKPLFFYARNNSLQKIEIPSREIEIYDISYVSKQKLSFEVFRKNIEEAIISVEGDFRQEKILASWREFFLQQKRKEFFIYRIRVSASSGTYIRSLIDRIGDSIGYGACSLKIKRISIGSYHLDNDMIS